MTRSATLTIEHVVEFDHEDDVAPWSDLQMDRKPGSWGVYRFSPWFPDDPDWKRFEEFIRYDNPAEAWEMIIGLLDDDVLIFVGPGESPATFEAPEFDANWWTVYRVDDDGKCVEVGRYVHRLSALAVVKSIIADGGCPVATSPYLVPDQEWDAVQVLASSELPAMSSSSDAEAVREAIK